jgi:hypothetical protein
MKFLLGHVLMDMVGDLTNRMKTIERYMAQLDDLIATHNSADNWSDQALELRKQHFALSKQLRHLKAMERVRTVGSSLATILSKLIGWMLIVSALIDDIDLGPDGLGTLEAVYG